MNQQDITNIRQDLDLIEEKYQVLGSAMNDPKKSWVFYTIEELKEILREINLLHKADLKKAINWSNIELNRLAGNRDFGIDQFTYGWHDLAYKANKVLMIKEYLPELIKRRQRDIDEVLKDIEDVKELISNSYESDTDPLVQSSLERLNKKIPPVFRDVSTEMIELKRHLEENQKLVPRIKNKFRKWFKLADQQASIRVASRYLKK